MQSYCKSLINQWILENMDKHGWTSSASLSMIRLLTESKYHKFFAISKVNDTQRFFWNT